MRLRRGYIVLEDGWDSISGEAPMSDEFSSHDADLLAGCYDCVDRIVLNAYNTLCYTAGGFRTWWRWLYGTDDDLDNAHLMRLAGRFARRVRGFAKAHDIDVVECGRGERKHRLAEEYLAAHPGTQGLFLILVARAVAPVWRSPARRAAFCSTWRPRRRSSTTTPSTSWTRSGATSPSRCRGIRPLARRSSSMGMSTWRATPPPPASPTARRATASPPYRSPTCSRQWQTPYPRSG